MTCTSTGEEENQGTPTFNKIQARFGFLHGKALERVLSPCCLPQLDPAVDPKSIKTVPDIFDFPFFASLRLCVKNSSD